MIGSLAHWLASGKLDSRLVLSAMEYLANGRAQPGSLVALLEAMETEADPELSSLSMHLRQTLHQETLRIHEQARYGQKISGVDAAALEGLRLETATEWVFVEGYTPLAA